MIGHPFWGYAGILFDVLILFAAPLGFAIRELVLLRRDNDRGKES